MERKKARASQREQENPESARAPRSSKQRWQEPKLAFVEPKLTKQGRLEKVTGFFTNLTPA